MSPILDPEATIGSSSDTPTYFSTATQSCPATAITPAQTEIENENLTRILQQQQQSPHHDSDTGHKPPHVPLLADPDSPPAYGSISPYPGPGTTTCNCPNHQLPSWRELRQVQWEQRSPAERTCINMIISVGFLFIAGGWLFTFLAMLDNRPCDNMPECHP